MNLVRRFATLVAALAVSLAGHAAPPTDASLDELMQVTRSEQLLASMLTTMERYMGQAMEKAVEGAQLSAEERLQLDGLPRQFSAMIRDEMNWEKMRPLYMQVYRETFTQEEIDGLVAFYRSPTGVAMTEKMPLAMNRSMQLMQMRMAPLMQRMQATVAERVAEVKTKKK